MVRLDELVDVCPDAHGDRAMQGAGRLSDDQLPPDQLGTLVRQVEPEQLFGGDMSDGTHMLNICSACCHAEQNGWRHQRPINTPKLAMQVRSSCHVIIV